MIRVEDLERMSLEQLKSVATNPNTSPRVLAKLVSNEDYDVLHGVATNPNTSPRVLAKLAATKGEYGN